MIDDLTDLLRTARTVDLPDWATHVAVSKVHEGKAEPCAWVGEVNDFVDEDPTTLQGGQWTSGYRRAYWHFFTVAELKVSYE